MKNNILLSILMVILVVFTGAMVYLGIWVVRSQGFEVDESKIEGEILEEPDYGSLDIEAEIQDYEDYRMAIHYPVFDKEELNQMVDAYILEMKEGFFKEIKENEEFLEGRPATFNLSFDIHGMGYGIYSLIFHKESYVIGANGRQSSRIFIIDRGKGIALGPEELIKDTEDNRRILYEELKTAFESSDRYKDFYFEESLYEMMIKSDNPFEKMGFGRGHLLFKFDKYDVTAGAAGSPEMVLSLRIWIWI